jgi:hypothetical protein
MCERCVVTSFVAAPAPRPLKAKAERGLIAHVRELLRRAVPRAEVIAQLELVALPGEEKASVPLVLAPGRRAIDLVHRELRK